MARVKVSSTMLASLFLEIPSLIVVLGFPRIFLIASPSDKPFIETPSNSTIKSPDLIPAR